MLTALLNKNRVLAENMKDRTQNYVCPFCKKKMMLVKPTSDIIDHFRHYNLCPHITEPESQTHLDGKKFLKHFFKDFDSEFEVKLENGQISDVFLNSINTSVEFQSSPISLKEFIKRNKGYSNIGVPVLWVFNTKNYYKILENSYGKYYFKLNVIERKCLELYNNSICYLDVEGIPDFKRIEFKHYSATTRSTHFFVNNIYELNDVLDWSKYDNYVLPDSSDYLMYCARKEYDEYLSEEKRKEREQRRKEREQRQKIVDKYFYFLKEKDFLENKISEASFEDIKAISKLDSIEKILKKLKLELNDGRIFGEQMPLDIWM